MTHTSASLEYRRALTQQASTVGLVIALHETLVGNLRRAAEAIDRSDVQTRCDELIHGFKVLTQLEAMLDMKRGGTTAVRIDRFYKHVRSQMLAAQFKQSAEILRAQMQIVFEVRDAWQQADERIAPSKPTMSSYVSDSDTTYQTAAVEVYEAFSCSC
jgi:flagellar protein FliS